MKHLLLFVLIFVLLLVAFGCSPDDALTEDIFTSAGIYPSSDNTSSLGSENLSWGVGYFRHLYVDNETLYIGGVEVHISEEGLMLLQGPPGPPGPAGQQGDTGARGPQGEQGLQGEQGIQGGQGAKGDTGATGAKGDTGLQGIQGEPGVKGDKGDTGDPGPTHANITILDAITEAFTTALKSSYDWLVINITSAWKATVDNFIASKGQANGLASLGSNTIVPTAQLGTGSATGSTYLRGDQTWATPPGGSTVGYVVEAYAANQATTTDGQTLYWGSRLTAPSTTANRWRIYIPKTGTIKAIYIYSYAGTAGTNEAWSMYIRLNNTTDTLIQTLNANTNDRLWSNTGLSIAVTQGNYIEIKEICPTWATNPANVTRSAVIYIE